MQSIGLLDLPDEIKLNLKAESNADYWDKVIDATGAISVAAAKREIVEIIKSNGESSFTSARLDTFRYGGRYIKKIYKTSKKPSRYWQGARIPLSYLRAIEDTIGVDYKHLENSVEFYGLETKSKIIPSLDDEYKLPIKFDPELTLALASVMWHDAKNNTFGFRSENQEQLDYLYNTFSNHFGEIPLGKESISNHNLYIAQKATTHIGFSYLDNHLDELDDYHHVAIVLGACVARGIPIPKKIGGEGIAISSLMETPMSRVRVSLEHLDIEYTSRVDKIIIYKDSLGIISSLYDEIIECHPDSEQFLSGLNF
ncbi:MAG: hypothetical protein KAI18_00725 [Candidatus Aenigmarchaeota archaeon]|nr:hypothetical protein [Candidatus Aenigmarchaeota archaeon]